MPRIDPKDLTLEERVIEKGINRTAKVVKGGRRFGFSALVVVGDRNGVVGLGFGKATEVPLAVEKAVKDAKKNLFRFPLKGDTIPHEVYGHFGSAYVYLKPAAPGTGVIAGPTVRAIVELGGVKNVLTKSFGRNNPINLSKAVVAALKKLRTKEQVERLRGVTIDEPGQHKSDSLSTEAA